MTNEYTLLFLFLAVAKALRRVAEAKAVAQAEAAEWKRKYELERERNLQLEQKGVLKLCSEISYHLVIESLIVTDVLACHFLCLW